MADSKTKSAETKTERKVFVTLRRNTDPKAPQQEFYSYNFKNYIIKRGVEVEVPEGLAQMIKDNEKAEEAAFRYVQANPIRES